VQIVDVRMCELKKWTNEIVISTRNEEKTLRPFMANMDRVQVFSLSFEMT